ncbi:hypothetical protein NPIRD3C_1366 [Nitrosopumilus piranensis]|uniref:Uncharacterized protein n=1 Tax=Nitrosopumilus piranensis TaxID=1582439 RepID=A0A0C5BS63_9ARCH|nr:hypothetical protein [Nitrosopumilus piranensis]AJM92578.1 hypothetical protein NPIRD3C_1366 [Nitrosopumilus piranensis]
MSDVNKDEEAQSLWEIESKRIQEIKNPPKPEEVVTEKVDIPTEKIPESEEKYIPKSNTEPELPEININTSYDEKPTSELNSAALLETVSDAEVNSRISFEEFTDEKILISHDAFGNKQMKIKVLEVSDETPPSKWKFGDRVKVTKILVTIKHLTTQEVEEGEFDVEAIERELQEKRHYTSTNRWIPASDIKNGYVVGSKHTRLISDASALDYIVF